jgi:hypothetical protein
LEARIRAIRSRFRAKTANFAHRDSALTMFR